MGSYLESTEVVKKTVCKPLEARTREVHTQMNMVEEPTLFTILTGWCSAASGCITPVLQARP